MFHVSPLINSYEQFQINSLKCFSVKPGVLRYGPPPNESTHTGQSPIRPNVSIAQGGPPVIQESAHNNSIFQSQQGGLLL